MACCKLPDYIQDKLDGVMKEFKLKKLSKILRVAAELSWSEWKEKTVVDKLYPEFNSVEKQGYKTRLRLEEIVESLTHDLKSLNYKFPPRENFCSVHMWFAGEISSRRIVKQNQEENRTDDQHATPVKDRKLKSQIAAQMPPSSSRDPHFKSLDYVISIAESVVGRKVFRDTANSLGEQELVPLVQRVVDTLSEDDNITDYDVISRVEAHLVVVSSLALYTSSVDEYAANSSQTDLLKLSGPLLVSKRIKSSDQTKEDAITCMPSDSVSELLSPRADLVEAPILPAGELVVSYDTHDAKVTANMLSFLTRSNMDWSVISDAFSEFVIHALKLRASRLTSLYKEKCAQVGKRMEYIEPMDELRVHTLQEDSAELSDIHAKYETSLKDLDLTDIFKSHMTLSENLHSVPKQESVMTCIPITIRWNLPVSLPEITRYRCRREWLNFQIRMKTWRTQIQQDPNSFETLQLLERIPEIVKLEFPIVLKHSEVRDWLDGVCRLSKAIHSRDGRKAEVECIVYQVRDNIRRSREALEEIKRKLVEYARCDHQVGILRERSQARLKFMVSRNKYLITEPDNLMKDVPNQNVTAAQAESDMVQEYTFGMTRCVLPWTFPQVVSLLQLIVIKLTWFEHQGYDNENLGNLLSENVDKDISLLVRMVCTSRALEVLATLGQSEGCEDPSSLSLSWQPVSSNGTGDNDTTAAHKKQRRD